MAPSMKNIMDAGIIYVLILFPLKFFIINAAKLSAPKVLLPYYSSIIVNFTLQVEYSSEEAQVANCYQWMSTRPDVAQVHLINSTDGICAQEAIISAVSRTPHQMTTVILAENKVTGDTLRSNVIVGEIFRLEIETTTRLLYLEDSPEELIARGFDIDGNIFSNLEGLPFEWNLILDNETGSEFIDARNILRIKRFTESHYITPRHIAFLENQNLQGDMILIEGVRTGSAKVSARLKDPVYRNIQPNEVRIMVVANLMLFPPDAYLLAHGRVRYTVELHKHNSLKQIKMPSKQYYLEVKDTGICRLDAQTSVATALALGSTEVVLKDRNIVATELFPQPSAMIHVVSPGFLVFVVLPGKKWVLETGREYEIYIEMYDKNSHKLYPSDNVRIVADFPEVYFKVFYSSLNGTYHRVRTLLKGETVLDGALVSVLDDTGKEHPVVPEVKRSQDVEIYDPITVTPAQVIFPWDPVTRCIHTYTAQARGGTGEFVWSVTDAGVASVNTKGQIVTVGPGKCLITAADVKNAAHFAVSTVHVLPPADMSIPPCVVEAVVDSKLLLPISVSAKIDGKLEAFTDCRQLSMNVTLSDTSVFEYIPQGTDQGVLTDLPENGCASLTFLAKHQGHTEVTVTYRIKNIVLRASVTIAAFNPLKALDPEKEAVVTIGASREITFLGGPQPWVLDSSKFFHDLNTTKKDQKIKAERLSPISVSRGVHGFIVTCHELCDEELQLLVGNGKTARNWFPVSQTSSVRFVCAEPVELHLVPVLKRRSHLPPCPIHHENNMPIPVHFDSDLDLMVTVTDSIGRHFDNFSSLAVEWAVSVPNLVELVYTRNLRIDSLDRKTVSAYQTVRPHGKTGSVVVTASIDRYKSWISKVATKQKDKITPVISKSLELQLVEDAVLNPSSVSVFNHPSNKVSIEIQHGSGYFYLQDVKSSVLMARYDDKKRAVEVTPLKDGSYSLTVHDLCIDLPSDPVVMVSVSGVSSVQVMVIDKVEVLKEATASVQVLDLKGKPLLASFFSLMELRLEAASDIITLRPANTDAVDSVTRIYTVQAAVVGHTTLTATIRLPTGQVIYSSPKPVEVFPPLRLDPKNITLIIGSVFQVLAFGGPQPQSSVEFSIVNNQVATVTIGGLLDAVEIGTTRVIGRSLGIDSVTGEKVVYSQDDAVVNVVILSGIRIQTALTRLQTGTQMPVYAVGLTDQETPFSFSHSNPPLVFTWLVSNTEVLHLHSVYHKSGITPHPEDSFAEQAVAKASGHVTIKLRVEAKSKGRLQIPGNGVLQDEVQIQVFEKLALLTPAVCHGQIRMTPNTDTSLKTNRDVTARVRCFIKESKPDSSVLRLMDSCQLRSGPVPGSAILHVVAEEEFGLNQTLVILVLVKPVSYLMINSDTVIQTTSANQLSAVPIGATLQFSVSYHDDVGEEFYATNIHLGVRCSRYDLAQVSLQPDNNTLLVRATKSGTTVLKVWDKNQPTMVDYVNIPASSAIQPSQSAFTLGSIICFSSPISAEKGTWGWWKSTSTSEVLRVEENSGVGVATGVGRSTVVYTFSSLTSTKIEVVIEPIKTIIVDQGVGYLTNSISRGRNLFFPVSFSEGDTVVGSNCSSVITREDFSPSFIPYHCHLELAQQVLDVTAGDLFTVAAHFDKDKGLHGCLVTQNPASHLSEQIATLDTVLVLSAKVPPSKGQVEVVSNLLTLDFLPAFYVQNAEIHLTTVSPLSSIRISSTAKVISDIQVVVTDPNLIQVLSPERDSMNVILFPIRLLDSLTLWEREHMDLAVNVIHSRTGHNVRVPVLVKLVGHKPEIPHLSSYRQDLSWSYLMTTMAGSYQSWFIICLITILMAGAMIVGYHAIIGPKYKTSSNPNVFLNTSGLQPSPPSSFIQQTPAGSPSYTSPGRLSPTSPKLWSVSYNQDFRSPPYKRNPTQS